MSKAGKLRAREQRKAQKRAKKESKRRIWESLIHAVRVEILDVKSAIPKSTI